MTAAAPRVRFDGIAKSYAGVQALRGVSFDVPPGCVHALVGENGAGKSTLMKVLAGAVSPDCGRIELDGRLVRFADPRAAREAGIAMVYQEFSLIPDLSVSENIFLGRWPRSRAGLIDYPLLHAQAGALCRTLDLNVPIRGPVAGLSVAQQQGVEIAKAVSTDARVLVLDEPSATLTPHELRGLFDLVRRLIARGTAVLYISHRMEEIFALADRVTVLRDGAHVSTRPIGEVNRGMLISECVGRELGEEFPTRSTAIGAPVLRVSGLSVPGRCADVSFDVHSGEVFALTGLVGSGRSTVARAIFGATGGAKGTVRVGERSGPFANPAAGQRAGISFVPEDRRREGLLLQRPLRENLTLAHRRSALRAGLIDLRRERGIAESAMSRLGIRAAGCEAPAATLSGGNQQKVLLGRWLMKPYPVMILDEPTRGVDIGAKVEIYGLINAMAARGTAVVMVSSELPEVIGMADRIGVMCRGRLAGLLDNRERQTRAESILSLAIDGEAA